MVVKPFGKKLKGADSSLLAPVVTKPCQPTARNQLKMTAQSIYCVAFNRHIFRAEHYYSPPPSPVYTGGKIVALSLLNG